MATSVKVYLPKPGGGVAGLVDAGSGIVGTPAPDWWAQIEVAGRRSPVFEGAVVIDFEGNRYDAANMVTYADRVAHAADRHAQHYPTVARMTVDPAELVEIGEYADGSLQVSVLAFPQLDAWLPGGLSEAEWVRS